MQKRQKEEEEKVAKDYINSINFDRELFNKNDRRHEDLHLQLSEKYMVYKDYAERSMLNP